MKQQPMARKLLALCLSLLLVLALSPTAWADPTEGGETPVPTETPTTNEAPAETSPATEVPDNAPAEKETTTTNETPEETTPHVAKVGETPYATVQEAIEKAKGQKVTLLKDTTESITIPDGTTVTLDLAGFTLTNTDNQHTITNNGTLTITGNGTVDNVSHGRAAIMNNDGGIVTIENGTFSRSEESKDPKNSWYTICNHGEMKIHGGTFMFSESDEGTQSSLIDNGWATASENTNKTDVKLTITGGTFTGGLITIKNDDYGHLDIQDGTFIQNGTINYCIFSWNEAEISGGTINGVVGAQGDGNDNYENGSVVISGGTITKGLECLQNSAIKITGGEVGGAIYENGATSIEITSGSFENEPKDEYIGDSLMAQVDNDGKYYIGSAASTAIAGAADSVTVLNGSSVSGVPTGVTVKNETGAPITVNGDSLGVGSSTTIKSPFTEPEYYPDYDEDVDYLPPVDEEEPEETEDLYMVTCRTLNVRLGGGTGYAKIGTLSRGTVVSGELENGWLKFTYNDQTAYCSADYLAKVDGDLTDMHVTCRTLNVRAGAGTNFEILGTLSRGTEVEILDVLNGWYKIEYLGGEAYVSAAYIG